LPWDWPELLELLEKAVFEDINFVEIVERPHVDSVVAHVICLHDSVPGYFLLNTEVPTLDVGRTKIGVHSCQRLTTEGEVRLRDRKRKGGGELIRCRNISGTRDDAERE
jgi:hypothetical protein